MDNRERIEDEVQKTLDGFGRDPAPPAGPDFYAGVLRKIRALDAPEKAPSGVRLGWRRLVPAALVLMVGLNIVTAVFVNRAKKADLQARQQAYTALAEDYAAFQNELAAYEPAPERK